jgi:hypothetical protein
VPRVDRVDRVVGLGDDVGEGAGLGDLLREGRLLDDASAGALVVGRDDDVRRVVLLTAATGSENARSEMPAGETSDGVSCVMAPMTATSRPETLKVSYAFVTSWPVVLEVTLAAR